MTFSISIATSMTHVVRLVAGCQLQPPKTEFGAQPDTESFAGKATYARSGVRR